MSEEWRSSAVCRDMDPDIFYPTHEVEAGHSISICNTCPVWRECLNYALANNEREGTWGAASQWERRRWYRRASVARMRERKKTEQVV